MYVYAIFYVCTTWSIFWRFIAIDRFSMSIIGKIIQHLYKIWHPEREKRALFKQWRSFNWWRQKNHDNLLNLYWQNSRWIPNIKINKQMLPVPNCLLDCVIFYYFNKNWVICSFFKDKRSICQVFNIAAVLWK